MSNRAPVGARYGARRHAFVAAALMLCTASAGYATAINITTPADDLTANGNCTLREAVIAANTDTAVDGCPAGSASDAIIVPAGTYVLTLVGTGEDAAATGGLDVDGERRDRRRR